MTLITATSRVAFVMIAMMTPPETHANQIRNFSTRTAFCTSLQLDVGHHVAEADPEHGDVAVL
ncbi:hypothetical protein [Streptomyces sp. NPDC088760]|uniref:hypothetical protein n=1 Tax=Streptomyces sp. NPDC088760 TaxID=3365890 RepID=UPI0037F3B77A